MPFSMSVGKLGSAPVEAVREVAPDESVEQRGPLRVRLLPGGELLVPRLVSGLAPLSDLAGVGEDRTLDDEGLAGRKPEQLPGLLHLVVAEGRAVGLAGVLLGRCGPCDDRLEDHEGRLVADLPARLDRRQEHVDVLDVAMASGVVGRLLAPVDRDHVPAVGLVALGHVLREGDVRVVLDRDEVLVVDHGEVAELLVTGQRRGLVADPLHDVAVRGHDVDVVVEKALTGLGVGVEQTALATLAEGHADGGRETAAQRTGGDLDALGVVHLGVARGEAAPGAQLLEVLELEAVPGEEQLDVLGQARVAAGEDEAVTTEPRRVGRVVVHDVLEEQVCRWRQ